MFTFPSFKCVQKVTKYHTTLDLFCLTKEALQRRKNTKIQTRKVEHVALFVSSRLLWLITLLLDTGHLLRGNKEHFHSGSQLNQTATLGERELQAWL